ncbi:crossover junction endodeoxyribonuclease RuvC [Beutenbergia cavernae DSM 12333]|uniref:Crossover junction endodeoxyribonuclease RuvC n=1 Tax=Beutenbergia cavernae (strain ATCC BAA-8 / DSM 12333 / CCUG 43141 / JCM 11478 / NBRC 16432 / NCIMB 13614 / HKI 0122) TaxID=471853 RepID=C5C5Q6_BEUC1|nr:crossover junction endodeoxyribonuclease RuvC [Beutenbergia cavernae DSM 12333]
MILGIDPGLTRCGIGVIESLPGRRVRLVDVGVATTPAGDPLEARLVSVADRIDEWLDAHQPDAVAVERVFAQANVRTITGTAQVAGLAMVAAARRGIPVATHTPSEVKAAITGSGRAEKPQVQEMVARLLALAERPRPADAADALALAICHAWRGGATTPASSPDRGAPTAAQRAWAQAEAAARRPARRLDVVRAGRLR